MRDAKFSAEDLWQAANLHIDVPYCTYHCILVDKRHLKSILFGFPFRPDLAGMPQAGCPLQSLRLLGFSIRDMRSSGRLFPGEPRVVMGGSLILPIGSIPLPRVVLMVPIPSPQ